LFVLALPATAIDREAFSFRNYDLTARVEPDQQRLAVRGRIVVRNDSASEQKTLSLQISSTFHWVSIQIGGKAASFFDQTYNSDIDHTGALTEAIVTLPQATPPGRTVTLEIGYEGIIPQDATRLRLLGTPEATAKHSDWDEISQDFSGVRGIGYVAWYPLSLEAANLADGSAVFDAVSRWKAREQDAEMNIRFDLPTADQSRLYCNGEADPSPRGASPSQRCTYRDLSRIIPFFIIEELQWVECPAFRIGYIADHKSKADEFVLAVEQVVPLIDKWFGDHRSGPNTKARILELPDQNDAGFESGNILLSPLTIDDTTMLLSASQLLTDLYVPSRHEWISHGLASYAQARYMEEEKGRTSALAYLEMHREGMVSAESQAKPDQAASHSLINSSDDSYVRAKAMNVWWMLRDIVGEQAFTGALHAYKEPGDKDAYYMQKLIEAQSHRDLGWFFDDWVYRDRGLPDFQVASVYPRQLVGGGFMVTVTAENLGSATAEVPVTVHGIVGEATERLRVPAKSQASVRIQIGSIPQEVIVNDGSVPESNLSNNRYKIEPPK
jgi:hypothetical protein